MAEKAIVVRQTGGPEVMQLEDHEVGSPGAGEALVRIQAAGVNFRDTYLRSGRDTGKLPYVPGLEGAGVVEAVGPDVEDLEPGMAVAWTGGPGSYASAAVLPAARLVGVPEGLSTEVAAAVLLQGMTAHYLVHSTTTISPGDVALVHAAAGGVGLLLTQLLKEAGATVIGTVSTAEKEEMATSMGADHVIRYDREGVVDRVTEITGGTGVEVVYDAVGQATFDESLASLRHRGLLALYGGASGPVTTFAVDRLNEKGTFLTRPSLMHYTLDRSELEWRASEVMDRVVAGTLQVHIGGRYPLEQAADAHRDIESRGTMGKLLLLP